MAAQWIVERPTEVGPQTAYSTWFTVISIKDGGAARRFHNKVPVGIMRINMLEYFLDSNREQKFGHVTRQLIPDLIAEPN